MHNNKNKHSGGVSCSASNDFITTGRFLLSHALLFVLVFLVLFSTVITSLGEKRAVLFVSRAFMYFARFNLCPFSLPLGVRDWLRLVTEALPGLCFY